MWLRAEEALSRLGSKPQSLYASVSRGRIRAKPDPADSRRSLYSAVDVDRLASRARGRRSSATVAAEAIIWGEPILSSAISTISGGRLFYRGADAATLADTATLEDVATLLWDGPWSLPDPLPVSTQAGSLRSAFSALAAIAADATPSYGRGAAALRGEAAAVLATLADALLGAGGGPLHLRLARHFGRPDTADDLRRALVLLADHELNASTFAARVTVSTGASFAAGALTGLSALAAPLHGKASSGVLALAADIGAAADPEAALRDWLGEGRVIPGFGHRLYADGDVRCQALLGAIHVPVFCARFSEVAEALSGEKPNVDFALAVLVAAHDLPEDAPMTIFALARCVGWLAHMLEQAASGSLIRPRARYTGPQVGKA